MNITLISPYHGGSHRAWAEGYARSSRHQVTLLTLPARFWKWRMHGGALTLARRFLAQDQRPDLLLVTDMLDLTTFLALTRKTTSTIPTVLYMHENQLTYPLPKDKKSGPMRRQKGERDLHYVFINVASMAAADHICFNSTYHRHSFLDALPNFLKHYPEYNEMNLVQKIAAKSQVLPVGVDLARLAQKRPVRQINDPPLILWNQRWEYDKNPAAFFDALYAMQAAGLPFQVALCGQNFRQRPSEFDEAAERLGAALVHSGYANKGEYNRWLWQADITISTAYHEFFGISILEALFCRTFPLLPQALSYPELLPVDSHEHCLYKDTDELHHRLQWALQNQAPREAIADRLATAAAMYDWPRLAPRYDALFSTLGKS